MKKLIHLFQLVIVFFLSFSSFTFSQDAIPSGTARYEALGYNPFIMDAAIDLNRNPAWGNKYNNYAFGDIGRYTSDYDPKTGYSNEDKDGAYRLRDQYLGVNFRTGRDWSLGVILNKEEGQIFTGSIRTYYENLGNDKPLVPFKALIAYNSSKNVTLGLAPYIAYWSSDITSTNPNNPSANVNDSRSTNTYGGTFGLLAKSSAASWTEGTVGIKMNGYSYDSQVDTVINNYENDGGLQLNAFYRGWYKMKNSNVTIVPYVSFDIMDWTPTRSPNAFAITEKNDYWNLLGGVGINFPINDEGMLAGGVSGGYFSSSYTFYDTIGTADGYGTQILKDKFENVIFPQFNIGLEWNLTDWMQGRFGYSRALSQGKDEITVTYDSLQSSAEFKETLASHPDQTITLGIGMQFGSFSLDGLIGERFIQIGPNVLSGKNNDLYGVLSMSYNFKK